MQLFGSKREIKQLQERVDKLEHSARLMELEWSSTYDKFRSILARIAKRQSREALADAPATEAGFQEAEIASPRTDSASSLSARQQEINARILQRRNRSVQQEREQ